jgi:hypothetical protein
MRTTDRTIVFNHAFHLKGLDRTLPAGSYRVATDEELIEGLSFPVYRRVATWIFVPAQVNPQSATEMAPVDPAELQAAKDGDAAQS